MKTPKRLQSLIEEGLIDSVVRQLMSGKEAMVYVVRCGDETRCAKVYKEATQRSFRQAVDQGLFTLQTTDALQPQRP
jgi:RIO kinase 1